MVGIFEKNGTAPFYTMLAAVVSFPYAPDQTGQ